MNIWNSLAQSGINLATVEERKPLDISFPTIGFPTGITFNVISGQLPPGLRILGNKIIGTPYEVANVTPFTFVIRATNSIGQISDRTFTITVIGNDSPVWLTPEGKLPVNPNGLTFVIDNTLIDYQLSAIDSDIPAGDKLEFFIEEGNGELPPGLTLSTNGRISGLVKAIPALDINASTGFYDTNFYDGFLYDYGEATGLTPKKLNRNYEFIVSVSDGIYIVKRKFLIYVVGDNFVRADNSILRISSGVFTADSTFVRKVYWNTPSDLGIKRANNYVTLFLNTIDPNPDVGPVVYTVEKYNAEILEYTSINEFPISGYDGKVFKANNTNKIYKWNVTAYTEISYDDLSLSTLPPGLFIDQSNGELFGYVPYQPAITNQYNFTISAAKYDRYAINELEIEINVIVPAPYGQNYLEILQLSPTDSELIINQSIKIGGYYYTVVGYLEISSSRAQLQLQQNLYMDVPGNIIVTKSIITSAESSTTSKAYKTFGIKILGEIDSTIKWNTSFDLGKLRANIPSLLSVSATTTITGAIMSYTVTNGELPPGLFLSTDGNIIGKVDSTKLTTFDNNLFTVDNNLTSIDRIFKFTIKAQDHYRFSAIENEFTLQIYTPDDVVYHNIYVKPYQQLNKREIFFNFITDHTIFTPEKMYRLNDPTFGIQTELKMLLYPGIESVTANQYITALETNTTRKRFRLGDPKLAVAKPYGSNTIQYEVIYLEVFDDYEIGKTSVSSKIRLPMNINAPVLVNQSRLDMNMKINTPITVDSTAVNVSGGDLEFIYPCSVTNMRQNLENIVTDAGSKVKIENEFLPLWMLTPQDSKTAATGFIKAIPLCYCLPGQGSYILLNITKSKFDFSVIDYEIDRFIIDATSNNPNSQYLKFNNHKFNV
jgi:hypothetical protein